MGVTNSKYNQHGGMFIQMNNIVAFGGQQVTGTIHINITVPMAPSTLYLIFKGKEWTQWEETRTVTEGNRTRTFVEYFRGKARISNFHFPIFRWETPIMQGGYSQMHRGPGFQHLIVGANQLCVEFVLDACLGTSGRLEKKRTWDVVWEGKGEWESCRPGP